ncbi:PspC domain-containing protein [Nonomuraea sp. NPDC046802]|uniref:PspC domain-containing protein n=1 Tax=Nonomuraea sp. NPDC046802 TaxID=3154919 RepID=UPI0033D6E076
MTEAPPREPVAPPRVLRRSSEGRILMGVCAGLGRCTGIDPVVFRAGFAVLLFGSGVGLFLYLAAFLLMKEPGGKPGIIEQWTRRDFDAETVMALLTAVLGAGLAINLATVWLGTGTLVVGLLLVVSLLAAHSNGVDLLGLARSMPERLSKRRSRETPAPSYTSHEPTPPVPPTPPVRPAAEPGPVRVDEPLAPPAAAQAAHPAEEAADERRETQAAHAAEAMAASAEEAPAEPKQPIETSAQAHETDHRPVADAEHAVPTQSRPQAHRPQPDAEDKAVTAEHAVPTQPRPQAYRPQPKTTVEHIPYGAPFAPKGPYQPLDPARRHGGYPPYGPGPYAGPIPRPERRRRPRSFIGLITFLLALVIGGIVVAVQARSAAGVSPTIVGGAMLITIGAGLLVATWWGRGAGLVAAGTTVAVIVTLGLMLGGVPRNFGTVEWTPTTMTEAAGRLYDAGVGEGRLDLSELKLTPGSTVTLDAAVQLGELSVIVPPTVKVEVHARNVIGDIKLERSLRGGVDVRWNKVLEPELPPKGAVSTIVLNLKGGLSDMEVRRAA